MNEWVPRLRAWLVDHVTPEAAASILIVDVVIVALLIVLLTR